MLGVGRITCYTKPLGKPVIAVFMDNRNPRIWKFYTQPCIKIHYICSFNFAIKFKSFDLVALENVQLIV